MKTKITINMDNDAFQDCNGREVARILEKLAEWIKDSDLTPGEAIPLFDINGNNVGDAKFTN